MLFDLVACTFMKGAKQKEMFEITDLRREILHLRSVCPFFPRGGGGGTLIFSYKCGLRLFLGFKVFSFNIFEGFQKTEYFWGYEDFVFCGMFLGSSQNWHIFRGHFYAF